MKVPLWYTISSSPTSQKYQKLKAKIDRFSEAMATDQPAVSRPGAGQALLLAAGSRSPDPRPAPSRRKARPGPRRACPGPPEAGSPCELPASSPAWGSCIRPNPTRLPSDHAVSVAICSPDFGPKRRVRQKADGRIEQQNLVCIIHDESARPRSRPGQSSAPGAGRGGRRGFALESVAIRSSVAGSMPSRQLTLTTA